MKTETRREELTEVLKGIAIGVLGDGIFCECFIAMLNSRNCIEKVPVDRTEINSRRLDRGQRPLIDHIVTHLALSRSQIRRADASGISRQAARQHVVRGHFKIRRTGIYWWSPFLRGDAENPVERESYRVTSP